jgi:hypothetical protein
MFEFSVRVALISFIVIWGMKIQENTERRRLQKMISKKKKDRSIFEWLGLGVYDEAYFGAVLKDEASDSTINNLRKAKEILREETKNELTNYYLLKEYLNIYAKYNLQNKLKTLFTGLFITGISGIGIHSFNNSNLSNDLFLNTNNVNLDHILNILLWGFTLLIISIYIWDQLTKEKRRIELIRSLLEILIKEEEKRKLDKVGRKKKIR